jgi:hypothetical protein
MNDSTRTAYTEITLRIGEDASGPDGCEHVNARDGTLRRRWPD